MSLKSFLKKVAPEFKMIGGALAKLAFGVALSPEDKREVIEAAEHFTAASERIEKSIKTISEESMSKSEVTALIKSLVKSEALK
jgi:hypothetical protein